MDKTIIKDLLIRGVIGISDSERAQKQDILVNITLLGDTSQAGASDLIEDCINYRTVAKKTIAYVERAGRYTVEALCADLARISLEEPGVEGCIVRVEKPGAVRFARSVGVEIERWRDPAKAQHHQAYLSLGSNINPETNLVAAIQRLREKVTIYAVSSIWETPAVGSPGPNFLNATVWISTPLNAEELKQNIIAPLETEMGRVRSTDKYAPRTIDIDILVFNDKIVDENLWVRDFLAIPTAELRPDLVQQSSDKNLARISQELRVQSKIIERKDVILPPILHL
jgi:2-amino-4-hydroxy-6-hydroxymethyldihydropteridine diphosphokinase